MVTTDPIADLLTRIRNAQIARKDEVSVPASKMKKQIAEILLNEGYIKSADVLKGEKGEQIVIKLKYGPKGEKVLNQLQRISKPGLRIYCPADEIPSVRNGLGTVIMSTSKGVITDKVARKENVGGEVLAYIY